MGTGFLPGVIKMVWHSVVVMCAQHLERMKYHWMLWHMLYLSRAVIREKWVLSPIGRWGLNKATHKVPKEQGLGHSITHLMIVSNFSEGKEYCYNIRKLQLFCTTVFVDYYLSHSMQSVNTCWMNVFCSHSRSAAFRNALVSCALLLQHVTESVAGPNWAPCPAAIAAWVELALHSPYFSVEVGIRSVDSVWGRKDSALNSRWRWGQNDSWAFPPSNLILIDVFRRTELACGGCGSY